MSGNRHDSKIFVEKYPPALPVRIIQSADNIRISAEEHEKAPGNQ